MKKETTTRKTPAAKPRYVVDKAPRVNARVVDTTLQSPFSKHDTGCIHELEKREGKIFFIDGEFDGTDMPVDEARALRDDLTKVLEG
jgi:hypothetical protein